MSGLSEKVKFNGVPLNKLIFEILHIDQEYFDLLASYFDKNTEKTA